MHQISDRLFRAEVAGFVKHCQAMAAGPVNREAIQADLLPRQIEQQLAGVDPKSFILWVREDPEFSPYYYDVQQYAVCSKPREIAAAIFRAIAADILDSNA